MTSRPTPRRIPSLDGLRALSIGLVFAGHLAGTRHFVAYATMARFGDLGNLGVRVFFVISGFLITGLLLDERARTRAISLKRFYIRRVLRIFPAFYAFIAVAAVATALGWIANDGRDFLHALTYTMNYEATSDNFSLRHLWSLSVEEQFYLVWPATLALLGTRRASGALVGVLLFVPVLRIVLYHVAPGYEPLEQTAFESVCDALATGALLAILRPWLRERPWFRAVIESRAFPIAFGVLFVANLQTGHPHLFWFGCIPLMNVTIALVIARYVEAPGLPLGRALNAAPIAAIGTLSYSLYLWQQLFLTQWRPAASIWQQFPVNILATFVCASLSYRLVEQPFLRLKRRFEPARETVAGSPLQPSTRPQPIA